MRILLLFCRATVHRSPFIVFVHSSIPYCGWPSPLEWREPASIGHLSQWNKNKNTKSDLWFLTLSSSIAMHWNWTFQRFVIVTMIECNPSSARTHSHHMTWISTSHHMTEQKTDKSMYSIVCLCVRRLMSGQTTRLPQIIRITRLHEHLNRFEFLNRKNRFVDICRCDSRQWETNVIYNCSHTHPHPRVARARRCHEWMQLDSAKHLVTHKLRSHTKQKQNKNIVFSPNSNSNNSIESHGDGGKARAHTLIRQLIWVRCCWTLFRTFTICHTSYGVEQNENQFEITILSENEQFTTRKLVFIAGRRRWRHRSTENVRKILINYLTTNYLVCAYAVCTHQNQFIRTFKQNWNKWLRRHRSICSQILRNESIFMIIVLSSSTAISRAMGIHTHIRNEFSTND